MNTNKIVILLACVALSLSAVTYAQPVNTTLPAGGSWTSLGTATFDTGKLVTEAGGIPGQMSGPYFDTSFGVMNEPMTPWFTGNDLSAQQFVQHQAFGNLGATIPPNNPNPWQFGFASAPPAGDSQQRFYNYGYGGTAAGSNFPDIGMEQRSISVPHWDNPNPDAAGVAADCDMIFVPVSATISIDMGWGADEMFFDLIGGNSGSSTNFSATIDIDASYSVNGAGAYTGSQAGDIIYSAEMQNNDAGNSGGVDNAYQATLWGLGGSPAPGQGVGFNTSGSRTWGATTINSPSQGIPPNSIGTSISEITGSRDLINIAAGSVEEAGGTFDIVFDSTATLTSLIQNFGAADGRLTAGPGMQGSVQYTVTYEQWKAVVPEPGSAALMLVGVLMMGRRRVADLSRWS